MAEEMKDGGPAFPIPEIPETGQGVLGVGMPGMSLRDYFAAKAMQGLLSRFASEPRDGGDSADYDETSEYMRETMADTAYKVADAMLKARAGK